MTHANLAQLLAGLDAAFTTEAPVSITGISYCSDSTRPGDAFFCVQGLNHDGHEFAGDAVARGASALVVTRRLPFDVPQAIVPDVRRALARASSRFSGDPTEKLAVVGITGTNGKTTTTYLLDSIFRSAGKKTGLIGTVETRILEQRLASPHTTPESADLQAILARMHALGVTHVSMEVSSHAIDLGRVDYVHFGAAAFTNLTQDHLDYHGTLDEYWAVKQRLFTGFVVDHRVVNIDDPRGRELARTTDAEWTVGRDPEAIVRASGEQATPISTAFTLTAPCGEARLVLPLAGGYNVSNALVAAASALAVGIPFESVIAGLQDAPQVPGRLERIDEGQPFVVLVDYAHTPDSLAKAIAAAREVTPGRVITVFGCGGDRDQQKRPLMGAAAGSGSDFAIVTSDNPRSEDPLSIIAAIEPGLVAVHARYEIEPDRAAGIRAALAIAAPGDTVLIAGKGHEDYQIFADRTVHFDDREVVREGLRSLC